MEQGGPWSHHGWTEEFKDRQPVKRTGTRDELLAVTSAVAIAVHRHQRPRQRVKPAGQQLLGVRRVGVPAITAGIVRRAEVLADKPAVRERAWRTIGVMRLDV